MAEQGFNCTIKITGTSTAFTGQACTNTTGKTYQLPAAYRILDPDTTPTVYDNAAPVSANDIESFDYLLGKVTFDSGYTVTGAVTMDGDYYPTWTGAEGRSFDFQRMREMLETTIMGQSYRSRMAGLMDASLTVESLDIGDTDVDSGGGSSQTWVKPWTNGTPVVLELTVGASSSKVFRFWAVEESPTVGSTFDGLVEGSFAFVLAAQEAADGTIVGIASA
jgi:hypothetical protein